MKAILLAAGLGTRLYPLTKSKPKALVEVQGKPLLQHQLEKLKRAGFTQVLINIHHFGDLILEFLDKNKNFELDIQISDEREQLLDTGGALRKARNFIAGKEDVLIHNVDVLSNIDISEMWKKHQNTKALASLAVRNRETSRYLLFNEQNQLRAWENIKSGEKKGDWTNPKLKQAAFSGIHIISPKCIDLFPNKAAFSIIDFYLEQSNRNNIIGFFHNSSSWLDVGKPETLALAEKTKLNS